MTTDSYRLGIKYAVITAVISGFSIFLNKYAVSTVTPAIYFTATKNLSVALLVAAIILGSKKLSKIKHLTIREVKLLLAISIIGGTIPFYLFFTGLTQTSAINAAILQKTLIIWVALFAAPLLKERLTKTQLVGIGLIFASNFIVGGFKGITFSKGEWMILASAIFWGLEYTIAKKALSTVDEDIVAFFRMSLGSLILLAATFMFFPKYSIKTDATSLIWITVSVLLLLGYVKSWYKALSQAPALVVSTILTGSTVITNVLSAAVITKTLAPNILIQTLMLFVGIYMVISVAKKINFSKIEAS